MRTLGKVLFLKIVQPLYLFMAASGLSCSMWDLSLRRVGSVAVACVSLVVSGHVGS